MPHSDEAVALAILKETGAVLTDDHFVYTSGRHGSAYVNKDAVYLYTRATSRLCNMLARHFRDASVEVVVGTALGGIPLSQWTSHHLTQLTNRGEVLAAFTEEEGGSKVFRRGYASIITGKRVLVVEDIFTTGGSARKTVGAILWAGGEVVGVGVICNRNPTEATAEFLGVPELYALTVIPLESWSEEECPLCQAQVPVNSEIGKGQEWLEKQKQQS